MARRSLNHLREYQSAVDMAAPKVSLLATLVLDSLGFQTLSECMRYEIIVLAIFVCLIIHRRQLKRGIE
jgi:hypothetical protein